MEGCPEQLLTWQRASLGRRLLGQHQTFHACSHTEVANEPPTTLRVAVMLASIKAGDCAAGAQEDSRGRERHP
jgi:hypothetical protein